MKVALLISTYNWIEALDKVLQSTQLQSVLPQEILIADDGSKEDTGILIEKWKAQSKIPIYHFWHEDQGFRKTIIMNKAVSATKAEYIIQIDGDIIIHPRFIEDHLNEKQHGFFLNGSRSLINKENTELILNKKELHISEIGKEVKNKINATRFPWMANFFRKDAFKSNNVKGCNFSFWREDFIKVNGYNNKISGWGHEDIELAARLNNLGIKQRRLKMRAICYHLHHDFFDRKNENSNFSVYQNAVDQKIIRCANGYLESI